MAINQQDFITPLTGNVTVYNNTARIVLQANTDFNAAFEGDESFKLLLRRGSNVGPIVTASETILLSDTSNIKSYTIVSNLPAEAMADTANVQFTINTINVSSADPLYYYTTGNVTSNNFVEGNTGTFNVSVTQGLGIANIILTSAGVPENTTAVFQLVISDSPLGTPIITSNVVTILDLNLTQLNATGGTILTAGGFRTHVFTTSGTFTVVQTGLNPTPVSFLVVAGGGGGGSIVGSFAEQRYVGGGGAGGFRPSSTTIPNAIASGTPYTVTVGGGGTSPSTGNSTNGGPSSALGITSTGGGAGGRTPYAGQPGGSGGGGVNGPAVTGTTSGSGIPGQGNAGSAQLSPIAGQQQRPIGGGGGGGAGGVGEGGSPLAPPITQPDYRGRAGGIGAISPIAPPAYGTPGPSPGRWFAGGGGGGNGNGSPGFANITGPGGAGGGGNGGFKTTPGPISAAVAGTTNTGGGGGGAGGDYSPGSAISPAAGASGGSGIVIIRYPYT